MARKANSKAQKTADEATQAAANLAGKEKGKLTKLAKGVADALVTQGNVIQQAEGARKDAILVAAKTLIMPGVPVDDVGAHVHHKVFLECFEQAMMAARGEKKMSDYVKKLKSNVKGIIVAVNVGECQVTWTNAEGKEETQKVNVHDWLAANSKDIQAMYSLSAIVRAAKGFSVKRGSTGAGSTQLIKSTTLATLQRDKLHNRLGPQGLKSMLEFLLLKEAVSIVSPGQRVELKRLAHDMIDAITEMVANPDDSKARNAKSAAKHAADQAKGNVIPHRRGQTKKAA